MPYHYYKPRGSDECVTYLQNESGRRGNHHRFITEKQVFARWAKQYNITFTHPNWWEDLWEPQRLICTHKSLNEPCRLDFIVTPLNEPSNKRTMNDSYFQESPRGFKKRRKKKHFWKKIYYWTKWLRCLGMFSVAEEYKISILRDFWYST